MEADVSNCEACDEAGERKTLRAYYLNLQELVHCCTNKQCTYHLRNAKLTNREIESSETSSTSTLPVKSIEAGSLTQPTIQWRNRDSLCWLDASMSVLVMIKSLRECINKSKKRCILKQLFLDYHKAISVYCGGELDERAKEAVNILNDIRDKLFVELQPMLKSRVGDEDSPLFALFALLDRSKPFAEHFFARYHLQLLCTRCGHIQVTCFQKTCITFNQISSEFDVGHPEILINCPECNASQQQSKLIYHKLSQCVLMQFVNGLPHNRLDQLQMYVEGHQYKLIGVIQYKKAPKHFVAWIRDVQENLWMECDDLKPCECRWSNKVPDIPANQIYMIVLERQDKQCISCFKQLDYTNSLLHSTVTTKMTKHAGEKQATYQALSHANGLGPKPTLPVVLVTHPSTCQRPAYLPKPVQPIVINTPNTGLSLSKNKFMGFQESKRKNMENIQCDKTNVQMNCIDRVKPGSKRIAITDNVLLDKYLNTCLKGNTALQSDAIIVKTKVKDTGNKRSKHFFKKIKQRDTVSVVMATIPDRLLTPMCAKKTRKISNCNETVCSDHASTLNLAHVRRKAGRFNVRQKAKFPGYSYGLNLEGNVKVFDGFTKNSEAKKANIDLTVPSPNPSVTSELSGTSDAHSHVDMMETGTPSECSLDSSGLDSQGSVCHRQNASLNSTLNDPILTFDESTFLEENQDDFLSSLLETNFVPVPFI